MLVTETLNEGLKRGFDVTLPADELATRGEARLAELGRGLRLPGFRPGKVPLSVVRQRYGTAVRAEIVEKSVSEATEKLLGERGFRPATEPKVGLKDEQAAVEPGRDLAFTVELELLPEIAIPDLGAITLERLVSTPGDEVIDQALEEIRKRNRTFEDVTEERPATTGDVVVTDFVGTIEGTAFPGGTATDISVEVGGDGFIPGFTSQLEGVLVGEQRTIHVNFPNDYAATELAGKPAEFKVTAKALKRAVEPTLDDALAQAIGFEDLARVRHAVREQMLAEYRQMSRLRIKRELLDKLSAEATFEAPVSMVEAEFRQIWDRIEQERKAGRLDEEDRTKDEETLRAEYRAIAERRVRLGLLLAEIGRANAIQVGADEMARAVRSEAQRYPGQEQQVLKFFQANPRAADTLRGPIYEDKVVDFVLELAQVTEREVPAETLAEMPDVDGGSDADPRAEYDARSDGESAPEADARTEADGPEATRVPDDELAEGHPS